jgi:hypothetical protein
MVCTEDTYIIIAKNSFVSLTHFFPLAVNHLWLQKSSLFLHVYLFVSGRTSLSKNKQRKPSGELPSKISKFGFAVEDQQM